MMLKPVFLTFILANLVLALDPNQPLDFINKRDRKPVTIIDFNQVIFDLKSNKQVADENVAAQAPPAPASAPVPPAQAADTENNDNSKQDHQQLATSFPRLGKLLKRQNPESSNTLAPTPDSTTPVSDAATSSPPPSEDSFSTQSTTTSIGLPTVAPEVSAEIAEAVSSFLSVKFESYKSAAASYTTVTNPLK